MLKNSSIVKQTVIILLILSITLFVVNINGYATTICDDINNCIQNLPDEVFKKNPVQYRNALLNKINAVTELIEECRNQEAINKLSNDIRSKADGSIGGNPKNDWIIDSSAQAGVCDLIDVLITNIQSLPACLEYCSEMAAAWCEDKGWFVDSSSAGVLVCVSTEGMTAADNCGTCEEINYVVWEDGAGDPECNGTYSTQAGFVYGGHIPCTCADNLYWCGPWDMQGCEPNP